jgi:hypothetical protein
VRPGELFPHRFPPVAFSELPCEVGVRPPGAPPPELASHRAVLGAGSVWVPNREDCGVRSSDRGKELWLRHVTVRGEEVHIRVLVAPRGAKWPGAKGRSARRKPKWLIAAPLARGAQGAGANKAGRGTADRRGFGHGGQKSYHHVRNLSTAPPSPPRPMMVAKFGKKIFLSLNPPSLSGGGRGGGT